MKRRPPRVGHAAVAIMVAALVEGPATVSDLAEESGLCAQTVRDYLRAMRRRRAVHVAAWEHDSFGRFTRPAYAIGKLPDARKPPPPRTRAEVAKHYRQRVKDARMLGLRA